MVRGKKTIKDLPKGERPREKLEKKGPAALKDKELLALILSIGNKRQNAVSLSQTILKIHPLSELPKVSFEKLTKIPGVGKMKAARILAALELGERIFTKPALAQTTVRNPKDAMDQVKEIADKKQEYLLALYFDGRNRLLKKETLAVGSFNIALIEPREIFEKAIQLPCNFLILAHNHPSGDSLPSREDIQFTQKIQIAGDLMGITLFDHLILGAQD